MNIKLMKIKLLCSATLLLCSISANAQDSWVIDTQEEWQEQTLKQENLEFKDGFADPSAKVATFTSKLKSFKRKKSATELVFDQSPIWQNWDEVPNLGPSNLDDAPVLLSMGPNNCWLFGRYSDGQPQVKRKKGKDGKWLKPQIKKKDPFAGFTAESATLDGFDIPLMTTPFPNQYDAPGGLEKKLGGYHAWQSRDMVNWVHHGPVTEKFSRWVTTAEYVDGKTYIYYDFPNDQDPHLYIDENLTDGKPGKNMGMAFKDPSHGSDCAFIRDEQGEFHVIYEDWSPIHAASHAWDSPLAGHAVSEDGIKDFKILPPAVDHRTTPTGKMAEYKHPLCCGMSSCAVLPG